MPHPLFIQGALLGVTAGLSPGPLTVLLISETLQNGRSSGLKIAAAPLVTDIPIVLGAFLLASTLASSAVPIGILSLLGALLVGWIGISTLTSVPQGPPQGFLARSPFKKALLVNLASPHPWVFWATVATPLLAGVMKHNPFETLWFILPFYIGLVGSKAIMAFLLGPFHGLLQSRTYLIVLRVMGVALLLMAATLAWDGLQILFNL